MTKKTKGTDFYCFTMNRTIWCEISYIEHFFVCVYNCCCFFGLYTFFFSLDFFLFGCCCFTFARAFAYFIVLKYIHTHTHISLNVLQFILLSTYSNILSTIYQFSWFFLSFRPSWCTWYVCICAILNKATFFSRCSELFFIFFFVFVYPSIWIFFQTSCS